MNPNASRTAILVLLAFPAGLLAADLLHDFGIYLLIPASLSLLLAGWYSPKSLRKERFGVIAFAVLLFLGGWGRMEFIQKEKEFTTGSIAEKQIQVSAIFLDNPVPTKKSNRAIVEIKSLIQDGNQYELGTKAWLYFDDKEFCPAKNEMLRFTTKLHLVKTDSGSFGKYLESQSIFFQGKAWGFHSLGIEKGIFDWVDELRKGIRNRMMQSISDPAIAGLGTAMMIGDKSALQKDTRTEFSGAGLSHVLAVSGMHIALLFQVVWALLLPFTRGKKSRTTATVLAMLILAGFAMLAGGGGSVLRAVFMFECVLITRLIGSAQSGMRGLLASIFFLLLIDPQLLKDPGFQLSCAAVWGILWLGPKIQIWFEENIPFLPGELKSSLAITLAAQASTGIIVIWHFETFPAWFIPANLIVVPLSNYVMKFGFAAVSLCWIPFLGPLLLKILGWGVFVLAWLARGFASLPGAKIESLSTNEPGIWILAGWLVLFLGLAFVFRFWKGMDWERIRGAWMGMRKMAWERL